MSAPYAHVEQDTEPANNDDELPTYDDLAQQNGPNSRFGRWRGWIEKRAAERYNDLTPENRARQRERGWGLRPPLDASNALSIPTIVNEPPTPTPLYVDTRFSSNSAYPDYDILPEPSPPLPPLPSIIQDVSPSHLKLKQFGSRFLPHTTSPIRCLLPLPSQSLLLIGSDEGLSVLDMYPQDISEDGEPIDKGPDEAQARMIWSGEGVLQMTILEMESSALGTAQGVVLALVAPEPESASPKEGESPRTLRMYNLTSLISLAKWAVGQRVSRPLDLRRPTNWQAQQTPTKKHRPQSSLTRGLKNLIDSPLNNHNNNHSLYSHAESSTASYQALLSRTTSPSSSLNVDVFGSRSASPQPHPSRTNSDETWDIVDDLPLRWATDFVPLATAGSRLTNISVLSYAIWQDEARKNGQLLAVATKSNILLYETPRGERAFRFVKEFYTPLQPRSITFFHQCVQDIIRSTSAVSPRPDNLGNGRSDRRRSASFAPSALNYGPQVSLFVIFDKKASWIRLADSAVGEFELYDDGTTSPRESPSSSRRSLRVSMMDHPGIGKWIQPVYCELRAPQTQYHNSHGTRRHYILTRGKVSHILPSPLPSHPCPPLFTVNWKYVPTSLSTRVCSVPIEGTDDDRQVLQLVALGEDGLEVQEIPSSFMSKGKGRARMDEMVVRAEEDLMGPAGYLCTGGNWDDPQFEKKGRLGRSESVASSIMSYNTVDTEELQAQMKREEGFYLFCQRGIQDYRVLWVGGG